MKRIFLFVLTVFFAKAALSQTIGYTPETSRSFTYVKVDNGFALPVQDTLVGRNVNRPGLVVINPADSLPYYYNGRSWDLVGATAGTNCTKVDSVTVAGDYLFYWICGVAYGYELPSAGWKLYGNPLTVSPAPDNTEFLGSTNNTPLRIKTNDTYRGIIDSSGKWGINNMNPDKIVDIYSTESGILIPRLSSGQMISVISPLDGEIIYNTDQGQFFYYNNSGIGTTGWNPVGVGIVYDATVEFDVNTDPNDPGTTFDPNTPGLTTVIYVSAIDNSLWTWNGAYYVRYSEHNWKVGGNIAVATGVDLIAKLGTISANHLGLETSGVVRVVLDSAGILDETANTRVLGIDTATKRFTWATGGGGSGVTSVTASPPLYSTGGTTPNISADTSKAAGKLATYSDIQGMADTSTVINSGAINWPGALYSTPTNATIAGHKISFAPALASQTSKYVFTNPSGSSGVPSFSLLDSSWLAGMHTEGYYDTKYGTTNSAWRINGNSGTIAGTNFIGTSDNVDVVFKRNNIEAYRLSSTLVDYALDTRFAGSSGIGILGNSGSPIIKAYGSTGVTLVDNGGVTRGIFSNLGVLLNPTNTSGVQFNTGTVRINYSTPGDQIASINGYSYAGHLTPYFDITAQGYASTAPSNRNTSIRLYTTNTTSGTYGRIILSYNGSSKTGNVLIGHDVDDASAILNIASTTQGTLLTRMTTTQRDAISSPATGLQVYNTTTNRLNVYNGTIWMPVGGISGSYTTSASAQSTFTVTIGATMANSSYVVSATPTATLTAAPYYVTNKTTTTFDVVYLSPLTGTATFDWSVNY